MRRPQSPRSRRKNSNSSFKYQVLELRKMLAGDLDALAPDANLIANGDFETFINNDDLNITNSFATARFYGSDLVPGWTVADGDGDGSQRINLLSFDNERGTVLDIDSIPNQDDRIFQDVDVTVGQQYLFSFDFFGPRQVEGVDGPPSNDFEVFYNGELLSTLSPTNRFQQATFVVTGAANDPAGSTTAGDEVTARIEFRDGVSGDRGGDGRGALIDAVSFVTVTEQDVVNGSFENNDVTANGGPNFSAQDVDGFELFAIADDSQERFIQIQAGQGVTSAADGSNFLNLNSSSELTDQVFQNLATEAGQTYFVTFDVRVEPGNDAAPDQLRLRFDNEFVDTIIGSEQWQSYGAVVQASSSTSRLTFREAGEDPGDGAGAQIDNVRFFAIDDPSVPVNDLIVDLNGTADGLNSEVTFDENSGPQTIASETLLSHDSGETLNFAAITLIGGDALATESLAVDVADSGIAAEFDSQDGILRLTGRATIDEYQQVIRTLTYDNTSDNPEDRLIGIAIANSLIVDTTNFSSRSLIQVVANATNDAPMLTGATSLSLEFGEQVNQALEVTDPDSADFTYEIVDGGALAGQVSVSEAGELSVIGTQAGNFEVVVAVIDDSGARTEQTIEIEVAEFVPFANTGALSNIPAAQRNDIYTSPPPFNIDTDLTYDAVLDTSQGEIRIRLLDDESPTFVNNFVNLARDGFYDGLTFHRVIDGFVGQGGDPLGTGTGGPGYQIPDEVGNDIEFDARGQLSFANSGNNTTGSQFFITFAPTNLNNGQFSVFGNVISGDSVLDQLTRTQGSFVPDVINSIRIEEV